MLSAKFRATSKSVVPTTTVSFTSPGSYSWTAPAGVTNIIRLTGKGGSGGTAWEARSNFGAGVRSDISCSWSTVHGSSLDWSVPYNLIVATINRLNTITTNPSGQFINPGVNGTRLTLYYWCNTTSTWRIYRASSFSGQYRRTGTFVLSDSSFPTSGTVPAPNPTTRQAVNAGGLLEQLNEYATGGESSAFNFIYFFPGSSGSVPPSETTYENISVVPGTSYWFRVGNNIGDPVSFIEFEY